MLENQSYVKVIVLIVAFCFLLQTARTQTVLPTSISQDYVVSKANSPYIANQDVQVRVGAKLTVEPGVTIFFQRNAGLYVAGNIDLTGTENEPIILKAASGLTKWEVLSIDEASDLVNIVWVEIYDCTEGDNPDRDRAAISIRKSDVLIDNCIIYNVDVPIFLNGCRDVKILNSVIHARESCDYVNFLESDGVIDNNEFVGNSSSNTDAIDFDGSQGIIRSNYFHDFTGYNTDAIDIGGEESSALIEYNIIDNINDKGISIGEKAAVEVNYNLIMNSTTGIASKDLSVVYASNNTLYQNGISYQAFSRDGVGWGGGELYIKNSIIVDSDIPIESRDNSTVTIDYSICNSQLFSGTGNLIADPFFLNPDQGNFNLGTNSPAIDAGDPNSPVDPDGTRADMGAFPSTQTSARGLIISEIHYRPAISGDWAGDYEFLELFNFGTETIDLSGFSFIAGVSFIFPFGIEILPEEYILVVKDLTKYNHLAVKLFQWWDGDLNDSGEEIIMRDEGDEVVFEFNYQNQFPWPSLGSANHSIELDSLNQDFTEPDFWRLSKLEGGSPGAPNDTGPIEGIMINEVLSKSTILFPDPDGDPSDWIEIINNSPQAIDIGGLFVSDISDEPGLYMIPEHSSLTTSIPSGGYIVLYASGENDKGILHLPFTLQSSGEQFGLFQYYNGEFRLLDFVNFPQMAEGESYGRVPDGSGEFRLLELPTPGAANVTTSVSPFESDMFDVLVFPNPAKDIITIFLSGTEGIEGLEIFDMQGVKWKTWYKKELNTPLTLKLNIHSEAFPPGIYFIRLIGSGNSIAKRFVIQ